MNANYLTSAYPTHLGETLNDEIEYKGISQRKLADKTRLRHTVANEILNGHKPLTEKTALMFDAALYISAELLLNLQMKYNKQSTKKAPSFMKRLEMARKIISNSRQFI